MQHEHVPFGRRYRDIGLLARKKDAAMTTFDLAEVRDFTAGIGTLAHRLAADHDRYDLAG